MAANTYGRQVVVPLTNKSGGSVIAGDVVIIDTSNNEAFTTTTTAGFTGGVGVVQESIASNATGRVLLLGYAALVNTSASVTRGQYGTTHTVAKQAVGTASRGAGTFAQWLTGGTTPTARIFSPDLAAAAGNVASDAIWDAAGDLAVGTGADTAAKLTIGAAGTMLRSTGSTAAWAVPANVLISSSVLGSPAANFDLTSISGSFNHLRLMMILRGTTAAVAITPNVIFNNDTGANYDYISMFGNSAGASTGPNVAQTSYVPGNAAAASATAGLTGFFMLDIPIYAQTTFKKIVHCTQAVIWGTATNTEQINATEGLWRNTAAITQITITPSAGNWDTGSAVYLYGIT